MDINSMTEKVQKAIMNAQNIAVREQHQEVDEVHLYIAMLEDDESLIHLHFGKNEYWSKRYQRRTTTNPLEKATSNWEWRRTRKTIHYKWLTKSAR